MSAKKKLIAAARTLDAMKQPQDSILAIVQFDEDSSHGIHDVRQPFNREPDFGVASLDCGFGGLLAWAEAPR